MNPRDHRDFLRPVGAAFAGRALPRGAESGANPHIDRVTVTTAGFSLHDRAGRMVAYAECPVRALELMRETYAAETVIRVADGAPIATKHRLPANSVAEWLQMIGRAA